MNDSPAASPDTPTLEPAPRSSGARRWAPLILGAGLALAGLAAVGFAQSSLEIHVGPPKAPSEGPDPIALLRDDVLTVQTDVARLSKGIGTNLEALAKALDDAAEARHEEAGKAATQRVAALERKSDALLRELNAARAELNQIRGAVAAIGTGGAAPPPPAATGPLAQAPEPAGEPAEDPKAVSSADATPTTVETDPKAKRRRGLFSFKLASGGPDFTQRQRYEVIGSLSRVGFDAKSTLHDFTGVTSKVDGQFVSRLDANDPKAKGRIRAAAADLRTGVDGRDKDMKLALDVAQSPYLTFELDAIEVTSADAAKRTCKAIGRGTFTIKGTTIKVAVPLEIEVDSSKRLVVKGEARLKLSEFKVEVPAVAGAIKVEDEVKIWLSLRFRSLGKVDE